MGATLGAVIGAPLAAAMGVVIGVAAIGRDDRPISGYLYILREISCRRYSPIVLFILVPKMAKI